LPSNLAPPSNLVQPSKSVQSANQRKTRKSNPSNTNKVKPKQIDKQEIKNKIRNINEKYKQDEQLKPSEIDFLTNFLDKL
ncbi:MAG: hypothetical protein EBU66_06785, partial [Bacteroidetes bacterium]|nr:hypothetical protein [Bacteroidota bacterium]